MMDDFLHYFHLITKIIPLQIPLSGDDTTRLSQYTAGKRESKNDA
jgi:hypothetical protein